MADCQGVYDLWKQGHYIEALTHAWRVHEDYRYPYLHRGNMDLRGLVIRACQAAVEQAWRGEVKRTQQWVKALLDLPIPNVLIDHDDGSDAAWCQAYRQQVIRAYLLCVRATSQQAQTSDPESAGALSLIADETGLPRGCLRNWLQALLPTARSRGQNQPVRTLYLTSLLVDTAQDEGVAATLTLELMPDGEGELYPVPDLAFVARDEQFRQAENDAYTYVQEEELWPKDRDVRWRLERQDGRPLHALKGDSLGGALALGLAKLAVTG